MQALVEVRDLRFRYPDGTLALDGVNFQLFPGQSVALFGPNGSGKTTFVLHLNGLLQGDGFISICGMPVRKNTLPQIRRKVGMVFQDSDEQLFMPTVLEDVTFGLLNLGLDAKTATAGAKKALEQVGMGFALDKAPYHLSAGEKRRVALAGVLAMQPEILVLDEPTTFLDPPGQRHFAGLLRELPQAKLVVTHDTLLAKAIAGHAVFFKKGKIVSEGAIDELTERFGWDPYEAASGAAS